jgi:hypothetical protein
MFHLIILILNVYLINQEIAGIIFYRAQYITLLHNQLMKKCMHDNYI